MLLHSDPEVCAVIGGECCCRVMVAVVDPPSRPVPAAWAGARCTLVLPYTTDAVPQSRLCYLCGVSSVACGGVNASQLLRSCLMLRTRFKFLRTLKEFLLLQAYTFDSSYCYKFDLL